MRTYKNAEQTTCSRIGKSGCYFLCLLYIAKKVTGETFDVLKSYSLAIKKNFMRKDCYVLRPADFLKEITKKQFSVRWEAQEYSPCEGEIVIARFDYRSNSHFVVLGPDSRVIYDPLEKKSLALLKGSIKSKRVVEEMNS